MTFYVLAFAAGLCLFGIGMFALACSGLAAQERHAAWLARESHRSGV